MNYLKDFQNFEVVELNEKISWKDLLLWSTLLIGGGQIIKTGKDYQYLNKLYTEINSRQSNPSEKDMVKINQVREKLITHLKNSPDFEKFGKKNLIDSIQVIEFKVVDSLKYSQNVSKGSSACFINIELLKQRTRKEIKWFVKEPSQNNLIVIRRDILDERSPELIIIHELYHYLDKLTKSNLQLEEFIDQNTNDKNYLSNKYAILVRKSLIENNTNLKIKELILRNDDDSKVDVYRICKKIVDEYLQNIEYFQSRNEIYARWLTLKTDMIQSGIIKPDQIITLGEIENYLDKTTEENKRSCIDLLIILNWEKLIEFQNHFNEQINK